MDYPKFIVLNQKEEFISIQRFNLAIACCLYNKYLNIAIWFKFYWNKATVSIDSLPT